MNHTRLWLATTIIAAVVFIGFVLSVPRTGDIKEEVLALKSVVAVPSVALRDTFKKGLHTIDGSIETPNACTNVNAEASLIGEASTTQSILIALSIPPDSGVCLQLPTRTVFGTTISAPAGLPITVTVNGEVADTMPL